MSDDEADDARHADAPRGFIVHSTDSPASGKARSGQSTSAKTYSWGQVGPKKKASSGLKGGFFNKKKPLPRPLEQPADYPDARAVPTRQERLEQIFGGIDWDNPPCPTGDPKIDAYVLKTVNRVRERAFGMKRPARPPRPPLPPDPRPDPDTLTLAEVRAECEKEGLDATGIKHAMCGRIRAHRQRVPRYVEPPPAKEEEEPPPPKHRPPRWRRIGDPAQFSSSDDDDEGIDAEELLERAKLANKMDAELGIYIQPKPADADALKKDAELAYLTAESALAAEAAKAAAEAEWPTIAKRYEEFKQPRAYARPDDETSWEGLKDTVMPPDRIVRRGVPGVTPGYEARVLVTRQAPAHMNAPGAALYEARDELGQPLYFLDHPPPPEESKPRKSVPETQVGACVARKALDLLFDAIDDGDVSEAKLATLQTWWLNEYDSNADVVLADTLLGRSASLGRARTIERLLRLGADPAKPCAHRATPFWLACGNGFLTCVEILFEALNDPECLEDDAYLGRMPLHVAAAGRHAEVVGFLLMKGAEVDSRVDLYSYNRGHKVKSYTKKRDDQGATALWLAAANGDLDTVGLLLQYGADLEPKARDATALEVACAVGHTAVAELLATVATSDGKLADVDPFLVLYPMKKAKSRLETLMEQHRDEAPPTSERIPRDGDVKLPTGEYEDQLGQHQLGRLDRPPKLPIEVPHLRQPNQPKDKLRWRGGFLKDADAKVRA